MAALAPSRRTLTAVVGDWGIEQDDSPGRPWLVFHLPSVADGSLTEPVLWLGRRRDCIAAVRGGQASAALKRIQQREGER
jgi:hypothetical protein